MKRLMTWAMLISSTLTSALFANESSVFPSTIPVVDMREFENPQTRQKFIDEMTQALHQVGFFAVINPGIDAESLKDAYDASKQFFQSPFELKNQIYDPSLNGQRGYVPSERAQGFAKKDAKEFLHIGHDKNLWPIWMNLQTPMENLLHSLDKHRKNLEKALSLAIGQHEDFLSTKTQDSYSLMRALYYSSNPSPGEFWAAPHTDIDLYTILPMSTEAGLQVFHNDQWIDVKVPQDAFIINCGDMLENMTNGYFKSSKHQVVAQPNVDRYSIVYFVHGPADADFSPLPSCVELTGGQVRFPQATELDMLAHRLVELGLASESLVEYDSQSGYIERIEELVQSGAASEAVEKTYDVWQSLKSNS